MTYKASLGRLAVIVTVATTLLFAFIIITQLSLIDDVGYTEPMLSAGSLLVIYLWCFALRPTSYTLTGEAVVINRFIGKRSIPRARVLSAEVMDKKLLNGSIRTFGVGGLFGYFGRFANHRFGVMRWYATRRDRAVLLRTEDNQKIVLTPDDVEGFLSELNAPSATRQG